MKTKASPGRRTFTDAWDEIKYLYDKLLYWLYQRESRRQAAVYARRLQGLLPEADPEQTAILGQECRSLVHEAFGDLGRAIEHRENEIRLIRKLHRLSAKDDRVVAMRRYGYDDLTDRLDLLASLYHGQGELAKAIAVLRESKRVCDSHGIPFDGADILNDYVNERATNGTAVRRR